MSSLVTQAFIFEKYGPRLTVEQMAELLGITKQALYNQITKDECRVPSYMDGGRRFFDYRDAAKHFDDMREQAA